MPAVESPGVDRVALITGAASGIGRATALRFLEAGYGVAALDRDGEGLEGLARGSADADRTLVLPADLTDEDGIEVALDRALGWKGRLDVAVNVSSILARVADPTLIAYGATKGGVSAMTRALAMKLAPEVRVNAVCPGDVATPLLESWIAEHPDPVGVRKQIEDSYPLRRICTPDDVAQAILFLAGPGARMITGQELVVDGGLTVKVY